MRSAKIAREDSDYCLTSNSHYGRDFCRMSVTCGLEVAYDTYDLPWTITQSYTHLNCRAVGEYFYLDIGEKRVSAPPPNQREPNSVSHHKGDHRIYHPNGIILR